MLKKLHTLPSLIFAVLLVITSTTGAILAFDAAVESASFSASPAPTMRLSELAEKITHLYPEVESISRTPSDKLRVSTSKEGVTDTLLLDSTSLEASPEPPPSRLMRQITHLHRALLLGDGGRIMVGFSAFIMLLLIISGLFLMKRQLGGWRSLLQPLTGGGLMRWHRETGRLAAIGLIFSALTGIYLSLASFELIPDGAPQAEAPILSNDGPKSAYRDMAGLKDISISDLREITFPQADAPTDPIRVKTAQFIRELDRAEGVVLRETPHALAFKIHDLFYRLHAAKGMPWLALLLGLSSLCGAFLSLTGVIHWLAKQKSRGGITGNIPAEKAEILLLVGSEGGTSWGYAKSLHQALYRGGYKAHLAAMNELPAHTQAAKLLIILTATAGNGDAPASASRFLAKLQTWSAPVGLKACVLGFGDKNFADFCGYAEKVQKALAEKALLSPIPFTTIDRQSEMALAQWSEALARYLHIPIALKPQPIKTLDTYRFTLLGREDYGHEVQAPTSIFRFQFHRSRLAWPHFLQNIWANTPRFSAGDLVSICPPGEIRPRFYSIASSSKSGILELCVRKIPGGCCSSYLHNMLPGDQLKAAIRPNAQFKPDASNNPLILIGAGTGIAPLIGFIREAGTKRPIHFYWGGRNPESDFLYEQELEIHEMDGRLAALRLAFSRVSGGRYVQNLITEDAEQVRSLIAAGAQILVCGGRDMANGVSAALLPVLAPLGLNLERLRHEGRLFEDVY